jgi:hypothetical protein
MRADRRLSGAVLRDAYYGSRLQRVRFGIAQASVTHDPRHHIQARIRSVRRTSVAASVHYAGRMLTPDAIGEDLTGFFQAAQISTPIAGAVTVELTESAELAERRLNNMRFDQAPVMHEGRPVGWVATSALTAGQAVKSLMTPLDLCTPVSAEASIAAILPLLLGNRFIFTVSEQGFSGFIVRSDIDRHAVRSYLYLLVSGIEMLLAEIVQSAIPEDRISAEICGPLKSAWNQARADGQETSAAEYLYIKDLVALFDQTGYVNRSDLWDSSSSQLLEKVVKFRNSVMHPVRSIAVDANVEIATSLPVWTEAIADRLRAIIASIRAGV